MNADFYSKIKNSSAGTQCRIDRCNYILENQYFLKDLVALSFKVKDKTHLRACCVLEKVCDTKIELIYPFIDEICNNLYLLKNDSAIRSIGRIILHLIEKHKYQPTTNQLDKITEACFEWLISDIRMAPKVYAMYTLTEIGKSQDWIYPELKMILYKDSGTQSVGYKAAAKSVLSKISYKKNL
jgi:hypothetical protein